MTTRDSVLDALKEAGLAGVSGEALAESLGVSRAAVAKHVASLREDGYSIDAVAGRGYALVECPDRLLPAEILSRMRSSFWGRLEYRRTTSSTSDECKELARAGAQEGTVCIADRQIEGRGRLGREWSSPEGGVYASLLLRPSTPLAELSVLPLVVGVAVARAAESLGARDVGLKWPNDVLIGKRKLAGILLEASTEGDTAEWVVVGVGINVCASEEPLPEAAYLSQSCSCESRVVAAAAVLDEIAFAFERFREDGFAVFAAEYADRSVLSDQAVTVRDAAGAVVASGVVAGVDDIGRLVLDAAGERHTVAAGDVTLRDSG